MYTKCTLSKSSATPPYPHIQQTMPIQYPTSRMYSTSIPHTGNIQQYSQIPGNAPLIRNVRTPFHPCIPSMTVQHPGIYQGQNHVSANGSIRPPQLYSQQGMSQGYRISTPLYETNTQYKQPLPANVTFKSGNLEQSNATLMGTEKQDNELRPKYIHNDQQAWIQTQQIETKHSEQIQQKKDQTQRKQNTSYNLLRY